MNKSIPTSNRLADMRLMVALLILLLLHVQPGIDLAISGLFYDPVLGWPANDSSWVQAAYRFGPTPAIVLGVGCILGLSAIRIWPNLKQGRTAMAFMVIALVLGPGLLVNAIFKDNFGRPRPRDIEQFGGERTFLPVGVPGAEGRATSFPSGHASMGFALGLPYFLLRNRRRRAARGVLVAGIIGGLGLGFIRVMQGGHFASDVIASGVMVYAGGALAAALVHRWFAPRMQSGAAQPIIPESIDLPGRLMLPDRVAFLEELKRSGRPAVSVIVPFFNEEDVVIDTLTEIRTTQPDVEIVAVDDGSVDQTWSRIQTMEGVTCVKHQLNQGQSAAIVSGLRHAAGEFCVLMDGDGQNDPADISLLLQTWALGQSDVVCGYRERRQDRWSRIVASRIANRVRRMFLHDGVRDTGCSLKLFHHSAVHLLPPFNGLHRYLPALFLRAGLALEEVPVNHRARTAGTSKYTNWKRGLVGIYDLVGVSWLLRRHVLVTTPPVKTDAHHLV